MKEIQWTNNLIKGKIAEQIFEQMFRKSKDYVVFHYGYEYTAPELINILGNDPILSDDFEGVRKAPDFVLIQKDKMAALVEVKFRSSLDSVEVLNTANEIDIRWKNSYLFIASKNGLYFDSCKKIIENNGNISNLHPEIVTQPIQDMYLEILNHFITK